jgi:hypothetical protein
MPPNNQVITSTHLKSPGSYPGPCLTESDPLLSQTQLSSSLQPGTLRGTGAVEEKEPGHGAAIFWNGAVAEVSRQSLPRGVPWAA